MYTFPYYSIFLITASILCLFLFDSYCTSDGAEKWAWNSSSQLTFLFCNVINVNRLLSPEMSSVWRQRVRVQMERWAVWGGCKGQRSRQVNSDTGRLKVRAEEGEYVGKWVKCTSYCTLSHSVWMTKWEFVVGKLSVSIIKFKLRCRTNHEHD